MTADKVKLSKKNTRYVGELTQSLEEGLASVKLSLETVKEPFRNLDVVVKALTAQNKDTLVDKAVALNKVVAGDVDEHHQEVTEIEAKISTILSNTPEKARHIGGFAMDVFATGQQLLQLNEKIISTTVALSDDYVQLLRESGLE